MKSIRTLTPLLFSNIKAIIASFCPTCGNTLDMHGCCSDCGYSDSGATLRWLGQNAVSLIKEIRI